jgi:hypothetical protein
VIPPETPLPPPRAYPARDTQQKQTPQKKKTSLSLFRFFASSLLRFFAFSLFAFRFSPVHFFPF